MCLGALVALEYPHDCIRRVSARDGNDYESYEHARTIALSECPPSLFVSDNRLGDYYYFWAWTWYEILVHISKQAESSFHLVVVDDWTIALRTASCGRWFNRLYGNLKMIQFHWSNATQKKSCPD